MKNNKKILILLSILILCLVILFIVQIYAKYLSSATGDTKISIASWNILVNNLSVTNNTDISSSIVPVFPGNEHISSNIIAPTSEGYFDLNLDFTNTNVSFKYEITTSVDEQSPVKDLVATGYSVDGGERINFSNYADNKIAEDILLNSNIHTRNIRVYILWNDDSETSQMSNEDDTIAATSDTPAIFHVNVQFTQITE